jgi:ferrous-iron efflux pump FieF
MTPQKKATLVSSSVAAILALIKLIIGVVSGSVVVLASAIDSLLDLGTSLFNYFALHNAEKPADEVFNYGRGKIEALAATLEGAIITISGAYIIYESISKLIQGNHITGVNSSLSVMLFSFIVTSILVIYLDRVAKKTDNLVIKSDALHYKMDVYSNGVILVSLILIWGTGFVQIDSIMGIVIGVYIMYSAYGVIKEGVLMLMDRALEEKMVRDIVRIIESEPFVTGYHYLKTRRSGQMNFVDVHLVFHRDIALWDAHHASEVVEAHIMQLDESAQWHFNIHLDPVDDSI